MLLEGTIVYSCRPTTGSMNAWKRVKQNIPEIVCPCKISTNTQLVVLESYSNNVVLCSIGNSTACTIFLEKDLRQL